MARLPFSVDRPDGRIKEPDIRDLPRLPKFNVCEEIDEMAEDVALELIGYLGDQAEDNELRTFAWNALSDRNWDNEDFFSLLELTLQYLELCLYEGKNPGRMIREAAKILATLYTADYVRHYEGLWEFVDRNQERDLDKAHREYDKICDGLEDFMADGGAESRSRRGRGDRDDRRGGRRSGRSSRRDRGRDDDDDRGRRSSRRGRDDQDRVSSPTTRYDRSKPRSRQDDIDERERDREEREERRSDTRTRSNGNDVTTVPMVEQPFEGTSMDNNETGVIKTDSGESYHPAENHPGAWRPSPAQPYLPAYNPLTHKLYYQFTAGVCVAVIRERGDNVDANNHELIAKFYKTPKPVSRLVSTQTQEAILKSIESGQQTLENDQKDQPKGSDYIPALKTSNKIIQDLTLEGILQTARLEQISVYPDRIPEVYRTYANLFNTYPTKTNYQDELLKLSMNDTYTELHEAMGKLRDSMVQTNPEFWLAIDQRVTKAVNNVLHGNLGINPSALAIESFYDDIHELDKIILTKYGEAITASWAEWQNVVIMQTFGQPSNTNLEDLRNAEPVFNPVDGKSVYPNVIPEYLSITLVDCMSYELGIYTEPGCSSALNRKVPSAVVKMLEDIFAESAKRNETTPKTDVINHYYVVTKDNRILELLHGHIGADFKLVRYIK